ncbi:F-box only protein 7-like [Lytechinus pictus]|uniref:F-box only protein 7-like n=1 Tax=Lytechinus pictus TaxID=7653 RepID=UPI0030B9EBBC
MKLRIRLGERTDKIAIGDGETKEETLEQLSSAVGNALRLEPGSFELSLNGSDPINGSPDDLLKTFGIVSGDLIKVLRPNELDPSLRQNRENTRVGPRLDTRINGSLASARECTTSDRRPEPECEESQDNFANQENDMSTEEKEAREQLARLEREAEMGEKISEPMLCRDAEGDKIPLRLKQLCEEIQPKSSGDALCLVLHVLMVETGFAAQQCGSSCSTDQPSSSQIVNREQCREDRDPDPLAALPNEWKTGTSYKLPYQHAECKGAECMLTGVTMGNILLIHGLIGKKINATLQLKPSMYASLVEGSVLFTNLAYLSRSFKDTIVYPLLATMRSELGLPPLHGLPALFPEIQLKILSFLNIADVITMSTVCHHFHSLINDPLLWRQLLLRDFGGKVTDRDCNWKNVYKERYRLKIMREQLRNRIQNSFYPPGRHPFAFVPSVAVPHPLPGVYPTGYRGGDYDIDPFNAGGALPGYPNSAFLPIPGPLVPNPRHDLIFPNPDANHIPGHGGGLMDLETVRPHPYAPQPPQGFPGRRTGGRSLGGGNGMRTFFR